MAASDELQRTLCLFKSTMKQQRCGSIKVNLVKQGRGEQIFSLSVNQLID